MAATRITLPLTESEASVLRAGEEVLLSGPVFTARDATHVRLVQELEATGHLPFGLDGQTLFYAGPTPAAAGRPVGSVGPTTAKRMDTFTPTLLRAGVRAMIGKGARSEEVARACAETGSIYFAAVGGSAALLATHVVSSDVVGYGALGPEALVRMELRDFPAFVALDTCGGDVYSQAPEQWRQHLEEWGS